MNHGTRPLRSTRRLQNLQASLPRWYNIAKPSDSGPTLISIYDEIGLFGVAASAFLDDLSGIKGDIELHLNSPGGDVFDGIAIYNQLRSAQQRGQVKVIVDGIAASAASFIAQAASPGQLEMAPHSQMMIHDGFGMVIGNSADLRETADLLDKASDNIAGIYADRTGKPADYWRGKMQAETWLSDSEAVAEGLADRISGQDAPNGQWDLTVYGKAPGIVHDAPPTPVDNAAPASDADTSDAKPGQDCPTCKGSGKIREGHVKCPDCDGTGKVKDPDGDGDDDTTAAGDTDHDYVLPDGKPGPKAAGNLADAFPVLNADVDNSPWDASKAWHNGAASDDPAAFYKGICAGRKAGDPSKQSSWALPYKYTPSSAPNAAGVRNGLARLDSTQGLTNKGEAQALLQRLMKQINPDYEPSDRIDGSLLAELLSLGLEGAGT